MSIQVPLTRLAADVEAKVVEIQAGLGLVRRLEALGIRAGSRIQKVSGPFMRGPVTVRVGNMRAAVGYGAASKVIVEIQEPKP
jgi:Fe2+ transport system protein FeoA